MGSLDGGPPNRSMWMRSGSCRATAGAVSLGTARKDACVPSSALMFDEKWRFRDCPWCGLRDTELRKISTFGTPRPDGGIEVYTLCSCPRCAKPISFHHNGQNESPPELFGVIPEDGEESRPVQNLPENVERYYLDARRVLDAGVPDAAAVQLRRTLEAAAAKFGHEERQLVKRVEGLIDDGLITKGFGDVLHLVRKVGNLGAHATDERVDEDTARAVLGLTTQILRNLFEIPHVLEALTAEAPPPPTEEQLEQDLAGSLQTSFEGEDGSPPS